MMTRKDRIYVALGSYFLSMLGLFFTSSALWFLMIIPAIVYVIFGGKKHV